MRAPWRAKFDFHAPRCRVRDGKKSVTSLCKPRSAAPRRCEIASPRSGLSPSAKLQQQPSTTVRGRRGEPDRRPLRRPARGPGLIFSVGLVNANVARVEYSTLISETSDANNRLSPSMEALALALALATGHWPLDRPASWSSQIRPSPEDQRHIQRNAAAVRFGAGGRFSALASSRGLLALAVRNTSQVTKSKRRRRCPPHEDVESSGIIRGDLTLMSVPTWILRKRTD